jgi:hypothetical protein
VTHGRAAPQKVKGTNRRSRISTAVLIGIGYALVGIVFAAPATHVQAWRVAAWVVSAIGYGGHTAYERLRLQNSSRSAALYVAFAAALGTFGLAVSANIQGMATGSTNQQRLLLLLALGIAPIITAVPAFLVALCPSVALARAIGTGRSKELSPLGVQPMKSTSVSLWLVFASSILVPFAILAIGFRLLYDSVIPEVAGLGLTGAVFAYTRPRHAWLWVIGIGIGIFLSERVFPATPPIEHVARYGPPVKGFIDFLKLCGIPSVGAVVGLVSRLTIDPSARPFSRNRLAR